MSRFKYLLRPLAAALAIFATLVVGASAQQVDPANPYAFEKKAYKPDGTPWTGPVNVGDTVKYVLTYKPGTSNSGPVTINDTLSPNLSYVAPTTSSPGWTWGSSPYATGNSETYSHPGFAQGSVKIIVGYPFVKKDGDGTAPIPVSALNKVFGVYHHETNGRIDCWNLADLSKCAGFPMSNGGLETPYIPQGVVRGSKIFFPGIDSSGVATIGCFDSSSACPSTSLGVSVPSAGRMWRIGGVVEDPSGRMFTVVDNLLFCHTESAGSLSACTNWPLSGFQLTTPWAGTLSGQDHANVLVDSSISPTKVFAYVGNGILQCVDTSGVAPAVCAGWTPPGQPAGGAGEGFGMSVVPGQGVCLWRGNANLKGCRTASGATFTPTPLATGAQYLYIPFHLPGTNKVYFPSHDGAAVGPKCFDYSGTAGTSCSGFVSSVPNAPPLGRTTQYGLAVDPTKPETCMLALGDQNLLWRFNYLTGEVGGICARQVTTPDLPKEVKLCSTGNTIPNEFKWTNIKVLTSGAAGTLTIAQGSSSPISISITSGTSAYLVPTAFVNGPAGLIFSYTSNSGTPDAAELEIFYESSHPSEICYAAKVAKCGPVSNTAIMKGTFNAAAFLASKTVDLGKASGPDCDPPPDSTAGCFTPDTKVTCGKTPGTYVITLNTSAGTGSPTEVEINVLTPGVTIVNAQSVYQVNSSGQVQLTVAGATPGTAIEFDISGSRPDPKAGDGMSLCCVGKIKIEIPKDIDCDIKPKLAVSKICLPAKPKAQGGFSAKCQIKVTSTGAWTTPITVTEALTGNGVVNYVSATDPWACTPARVISPAPMSCVLPANTLNPVTDTSIINVTVDFNNANDAKKAKNCAWHQINATTNGVKSCVPFTVEEKSTVNITKKCEAVTEGEFEVGQGFMSGFGSKCIVTINTTGPQSGTLSFADNLTGGTLTLLSSTSTPAWTCNSPTCSIAGSALNQTSSTSTFELYSVFANTGAVNEGRNCAVVRRNQTQLDKDCVTFNASEHDLSIKKTGQILNQAVLGYGFEIEVTNQGSPFNGNQIVEVTDVVPAGMTFTSATGTDWSCSTLPATAGQTITCQYTGAGPATTGASLGKIKIATSLTGTPDQGKGPFKNCADVFLTANAGLTETTLANNQSCATVQSEPEEPTPKLSLTKTCSSVQQTAAGYVSQCVIHVASTGPVTTDVVIQDTLSSAAGVLTGATGSFGWNCGNWGTDSEQCSMSAADFNNNGNSATLNVSVLYTSNAISTHQNCANFAGQPVTDACAPILLAPGQPGTLAVSKTCDAGTSIPGTKEYQALCHITVTGSGNLPPVIKIEESLLTAPSSNSSHPSFTAISSSENWTFPPLPLGVGTSTGGFSPPVNITLPSVDLLAAGGTSVIDVTMKVYDFGWLQETQNCVSGSGVDASGNPSAPPLVAAQICVQLTGTPPNQPKVPPTLLSCNSKTAKRVGQECRCTIRGMVPESKTSCACPKGQKVTNGRCSVPPPPPPKCDGDTAKLQGNRCVCTVRGMVPVAKTSCACPKGQKVINGRCTVPPPPPPKCDGDTAKLKGNRCVCTLRGMVPVSKSACACRKGESFKNGACRPNRPDCPRGAVFDGKRCIEQVRNCEPGQIRIGRRCITVPDCPRGQIPLPGLGQCIDVKRPPKDKECRDGDVIVPCR